MVRRNTAKSDENDVPTDGGQGRFEPVDLGHLAPSDWEDISEEIAGFADPKRAPVAFVPTGFRLFDNRQDDRKTSVLIIGELLEPRKISARGEEDENIDGVPGDIIGIWGSPGMKGVADRYGVPVWLAYKGLIDVGKQSPMKTYHLRVPPNYKRSRERVPVVGDYRKMSKRDSSWAEGDPTGQIPPDRDALPERSRF